MRKNVPANPPVEVGVGVGGSRRPRPTSHSVMGCTRLLVAFTAAPRPMFECGATPAHGSPSRSPARAMPNGPPATGVPPDRAPAHIRSLPPPPTRHPVLQRRLEPERPCPESPYFRTHQSQHFVSPR